MRNDSVRRTALGLVTTLYAVVLAWGTGAPASALAVEARSSSVDSRGRLVVVAGEPVVLHAAGGSEGGPYRWSCRPEDGGEETSGEDEVLRSRLGVGVYEVTLEAGGETARASLVVRRTPVVVVGGWAGGLDREALAGLATDYDTGYREDVLDPLDGGTLTANAWVDVFGRRSLRGVYAPLVAEVIAETRYRTGVPQVDVVAFGVAGLAVRWLVRHDAPAGIRRAVYVGTPTHGTDLVSPSFRSFEHRAGLVAGMRLTEVLKGLGPRNGAELLEMSDRLAGRLPESVTPERVAASLALLGSQEAVPHSSFLAALNGHRGMLPATDERMRWGPDELVLAGSWGRTATHAHVPVPGVGVSVAVPRLAAGDRVTVAESTGWGSGAVPVEGLSYLELSPGNPALLPPVLDFLRAPRPRPPLPPPAAAKPPARAAQILFAEGLGYYPPYPHKYDFNVEASARSLVLTLSSPAKLGLHASFRTQRGVQRLFNNSPGVETVAGAAMVEIHLERPQSGPWTAEVMGARKGGAYSVSGTYETPTYVGAGVSETRVAPGEAVTVYAYAVQPEEDPLAPVPVQVEAKVWLGEESFEVPLHDDGLNGDGEAGDGLYAGTFEATERPGTYLVTVEGFLAEGRQQLYRWAYERFTVEALPDLAAVGRMLLCETSPRASEPFGVAVLVNNWGDAGVPGAVVELFDDFPRFGDRLLARAVVDVEAHGEAVARFYVELPAGEHRLRARVSALHGLLERTYSNNSARLALQVAGPEAASPAAAAPEPALEILSPPSGVRIGERAVVTVRAADPGIEAVEVSFNGRPAGSCAARGRTRFDCDVPVVASAVRGKKLRVTAVARSAGGTVRREALYTLDRKLPKLRVGKGVVDGSNRLRLSYRVRSREGAGEVLAVGRGVAARGAEGEVGIEAPRGSELVLYAADRACNLARATYVVPLPPGEIMKDGFESGGLRGWKVSGGKPGESP